MDLELTAKSVGAGLLGRPAEITQIALVVRDLDATMKQYTELLGWGPWKVYRHEPPRLHTTTVRGERVDYTMLHAETEVNGIGFELLQPLEGPSIYQEWLNDHGEGLHHVAVSVRDRQESARLKERFAEAGVPVLMDGLIGDSVEFYYLDTQPLLKLIVEAGAGHGEAGELEFQPDRIYPEVKP
jgi:methylmalonyl-CoA/ethylmalonyl-CoA epimerase